MDADLFKAESLLESTAEYLLRLCLRRCVVAVKASRVRQGKRFPVKLAVGF